MTSDVCGDAKLSKIISDFLMEAREAPLYRKKMNIYTGLKKFTSEGYESSLDFNNITGVLFFKDGEKASTWGEALEMLNRSRLCYILKNGVEGLKDFYSYKNKNDYICVLEAIDEKNMYLAQSCRHRLIVGKFAVELGYVSSLATAFEVKVEFYDSQSFFKPFLDLFKKH